MKHLYNYTGHWFWWEFQDLSESLLFRIRRPIEKVPTFLLHTMRYAGDPYVLYRIRE